MIYRNEELKARLIYPMGSYLYTPAIIEPTIEPNLPQISPISREPTPYYPPDGGTIILDDNISLDEKKGCDDIPTIEDERRSHPIDAPKRNRRKKKGNQSRHYLAERMSRYE